MHDAIDRQIGRVYTAIIYIDSDDKPAVTKGYNDSFMHYLSILKVFEAFYYGNKLNYFGFEVGVANER